MIKKKPVLKRKPSTRSKAAQSASNKKAARTRKANRSARIIDTSKLHRRIEPGPAQPKVDPEMVGLALGAESVHDLMKKRMGQ